MTGGVPNVKKKKKKKHRGNNNKEKSCLEDRSQSSKFSPQDIQMHKYPQENQNITNIQTKLQRESLLCHFASITTKREILEGWQFVFVG